MSCRSRSSTLIGQIALRMYRKRLFINNKKDVKIWPKQNSYFLKTNNYLGGIDVINVKYTKKKQIGCEQDADTILEIWSLKHYPLHHSDI